MGILWNTNIRWKFYIDGFSKFIDGNDEKLGMSPSTNRDCLGNFRGVCGSVSIRVLQFCSNWENQA